MREIAKKQVEIIEEYEKTQKIENVADMFFMIFLFSEALSGDRQSDLRACAWCSGCPAGGGAGSALGYATRRGCVERGAQACPC